MSTEYQGPERRRAWRSNDDDGSLRREANEQLVLTVIRAEEEKDTAVSEHRRAQEETRQGRAREDELLITAEFRERLIGIIGHDLRNPLNTIIMASALQVSRGNLTEEDARLATRIMSTGQRMAGIIGQLVEFTQARLGSGFALKLQACDMGSVCRDIAEELRISSSSEIRLIAEGDLAGSWDADRVAQALSNIAGNAVNHATTGTPIVIHACGEAAAVVVNIANQGVCIPDDLLPVIFNAFRGSEANGKATNGHLGLGLYIASEIVRSHAGTIGVTSVEGRTTFTMRLPRGSAL